jgi:hypothetical protein
MRDQHLGFGANLVRGGGTYHYRKPAADDAPDRPVMWSDTPHRAVLAGEPWGGEGGIATTDHPAVAFVLTRDLRVQELSVEALNRVIAQSSLSSTPTGGPRTGD